MGCYKFHVPRNMCYNSSSRCSMGNGMVYGPVKKIPIGFYVGGKKIQGGNNYFYRILTGLFRQEAIYRMIKTIKVETIIDEVNYRNSHSSCSKEVREGWNGLLEYFLHSNGVYNGFQYLTADKMRGDAAGREPGILVGPGVGAGGAPSIQDETRRHYFSHSKLTGVQTGYGL